MPLGPQNAAVPHLGLGWHDGILAGSTLVPHSHLDPWQLRCGQVWGFIMVLTKGTHSILLNPGQTAPDHGPDSCGWGRCGGSPWC